MIVQTALLLLAGGVAAQHIRVPLNWDHSGLLIVATAAIFFVHRGVAWFAVGMTAFVLAAQWSAADRVAPRFSGDSMRVVVRVVSFPKTTGKTISMVVRSGDDPRLPTRSRVSWFEPPVVPRLGDIWQLELRLRRPRGYANPGGFDQDAWLLRERIGATGYVVAGHRNRLLSSNDLSLLERCRQRAVDAIQRAAAADPAAVLTAVAIGSRHLMSAEQWEAYAATGTTHLMAISGLHVGLSGLVGFGFAFGIAALLRRSGNHLDSGVVGSVIVAGAYTLISGAGIPAQRAFLMLLMGACALRLRRRVVSADVMAMAAALVFLGNPLAAMMPGFWLSFGAVAVLVWIAQPLQPNGRAGGVFSIVSAALCSLQRMQIFLLAGLMPLTVAYFQRVALTAPVVNLIVVPVFSVVAVPATLIALALLPLSATAGDVFLRLAAVGVNGVEAVVALFNAAPAAAARVPQLSAAMFIVLWLPLLWVVLPKGWPGRGLAPIAALALLLHRPEPPPTGCFDVHVLDVGQGLAVVVQTRQQTLLYDSGVAFRGGGSVAQQTILPFLRYRGVQRLDWLIVSHADLDHAGGVADIVNKLPPDRVLVGESLPLAGLNAFRCAAGQRWSVDGIDFRLLHPGDDGAPEGNNRSCVVEISAGLNRLLLTGDVEQAAEAAMIGNGQLRPATLVVIPHHGSATSSGQAFVTRLRTEVAIASAGFDNRWGFPRPPVVRRWLDSGAEVLTTATDGAISARVCEYGGVRSLRRERPGRQRFWHDRDPPL